jgi:hypothetical protein
MSDNDTRMSGSRRNISISLSEEYAQLLNILEIKYQKRQLFEVALDTFLLEMAQLRRSGGSLVDALKVEHGGTTYALYFYGEQWSDIDALSTELKVGVSSIVYTMMANLAQRLLEGLGPEQRAHLEPYRDLSQHLLVHYAERIVPELDQQRQKETAQLKAELKARGKGSEK